MNERKDKKLRKSSREIKRMAQQPLVENYSVEKIPYYFSEFVALANQQGFRVVNHD